MPPDQAGGNRRGTVWPWWPCVQSWERGFRRGRTGCPPESSVLPRGCVVGLCRVATQCPCPCWSLTYDQKWKQKEGDCLSKGQGPQGALETQGK